MGKYRLSPAKPLIKEGPFAFRGERRTFAASDLLFAVSEGPSSFLAGEGWTIVDEYAPPESFDVACRLRAGSHPYGGACAVAGNRPPRNSSIRSPLSEMVSAVILSEDHSTPIVHVSVTYHVGSKNERAGRTGFAHLFEHMMFKGSKNVEPESHTSIVASVGGRSNAFTTEDETVFWQTLPSHYLPLALWLEADRMATLRVDDEAFRREREVVKEERRMRVENQPYGRLSEIIFDHAFTVHPYKHPTIGSMVDLEAASIADVREFHQTYYVPENATVTIVGDFEAEQTLQMVNQHSPAFRKRSARFHATCRRNLRRRRNAVPSWRSVAIAGGCRRVSHYLRRSSRRVSIAHRG